MNYYAIPLMVIVVAGLFFAGCTQSSGNVPVSPSVPAVSAGIPDPGVTPDAAVTGTPQQVVTVIRQVSLTRDIKDTELLFALQVPIEWQVSTYRPESPENSEGLTYRTDLLPNDTFVIYTYTASRGQDQAYRDEFRKWSPVPAETTVTLNGITCDRFESVSGGKARVAYVARKGSANERGYASVLVFTADTGNRFEKDDFEKVVSSFRYFTAYTAGTVPGEEIVRIIRPSVSSGSASSRTGSGDSGSTGAGCSRCGI